MEAHEGEDYEYDQEILTRKLEELKIYILTLFPGNPELIKNTLDIFGYDDEIREAILPLIWAPALIKSAKEIARVVLIYLKYELYISRELPVPYKYTEHGVSFYPEIERKKFDADIQKRLQSDKLPWTPAIQVIIYEMITDASTWRVHPLLRGEERNIDEWSEKNRERAEEEIHKQSPDGQYKQLRKEVIDIRDQMIRAWRHGKMQKYYELEDNLQGVHRKMNALRQKGEFGAHPKPGVIKFSETTRRFDAMDPHNPGKTMSVQEYIRLHEENVLLATQKR